LNYEALLNNSSTTIKITKFKFFTDFGFAQKIRI